LGKLSYNYATGRPQKNYLVALLLSIFLGTLGIDRFYLGHVGLGVAKLLLSWATFGVWQLIDIIIIAMRKVDSSQFDWDDIPAGAPNYNRY
jgi:TM2 domain-containing membrane protein YozV